MTGFRDAMARLQEKIGPFHTVIPTVTGVVAQVRAGVADWPGPVLVITGQSEKYDAFAASSAALAASGTVALELALAGVPSAVAWRSARALWKI